MKFTEKSRFESSVIYEGTKTIAFANSCVLAFESSVIYEGTKTRNSRDSKSNMFESSVIYEGTKTIIKNNNVNW